MSYLNKILFSFLVSILTTACARTSAQHGPNVGSNSGAAYFRVKGGFASYDIRISRFDSSTAEGGANAFTVKRPAVLIRVDPQEFVDYKIVGESGRYIFESVAFSYGTIRGKTCFDEALQFEIRPNEVNYIRDFVLDSEDRRPSRAEFDYLGRSPEIGDVEIAKEVSRSSFQVNNTAVQVADNPLSRCSY